ncbi:bifunctional UDP-N-acetylglucosamine diphosphorylase/glucosamine-1-phosphate N-acetyltransferase GlmU [Desulfotomaculum copahuensis]|uniref:Bifunctional protein GlmU n=1 Tax=Desulfotomaculum copahuensis TaxID=1838280 RepID=A0A1B7LFL8_9FIRM|nr:bifunctional UDP-N-acetylglucosamine diphosphorylase/glucosamine-1-phosphate N-acetyltransferase GlmU [Desulfotomaculum copahuensis]OAT82942.1 UDP-N-acetylglucosamine diphosphorylase/glucosamine-1-phosphate N-acetyltransferase [Desulfotomaculum copahuensis]
MSLAAVILAAGKGTRMKSERPKVMHEVCGRPMVEHVLCALQQAGAQEIVTVSGFGGEQVAALVGGRSRVARQSEQLGTAHALLQAREQLAGFDGDILVVCGDTPLITAATLKLLADAHKSAGAAATVLTARVEDPAGYGRIIRDETGRVRRIVEQKDATAAELAVDEINTGMYCFAADGLFEALAAVKPANAQGEYYLTDVIGFLAESGRPVAACPAPDEAEIRGVNDRRQLAQAEKIMRRRILDGLMLDGVTVIDPASTFVDAGVAVGRDTVILPFTLITGRSVIGRACRIGPGSQLVDVRAGDGVSVSHSVVCDSVLSDQCTVGPFAYIRPGCRLERGVKVGDFVELKKTALGEGSKVPHLSYVGDATVGRRVNIGAGTITCNYDGENKWPTRIGDGAFIGSNTSLVAPVNVGDGAVTAAGSAITRDVPPQALGVARGRQRNIENWPERKKLKPGHAAGRCAAEGRTEGAAPPEGGGAV